MVYYLILVFIIISTKIIDANIIKGKYYVSFSEGKFGVHSFKDAEGICNSFGSNLASIHNEEQMTDAVSIIQNMNYAHHYIGYYSSGLKWGKWTDGSFNNYTNWGLMEPTYDENASCVAITTKTGEWKNILCDIRHNDLLVDLYPFYPLCNSDGIAVSIDDEYIDDDSSHSLIANDSKKIGNNTEIDIILINDNPCPMTNKYCVLHQDIVAEIVNIINETAKISYIKFDAENVVVKINDSLQEQNSSIYYHHLIKNGDQCKYSLDKKNGEAKLHYAMKMAMDHIEQFEEKTHFMVIFNDCQVKKSQQDDICQHFKAKMKSKINLNTFVVNSGEQFKSSDGLMICLTKYDIKDIYNNTSKNKSHYLQNMIPNIRRRLEVTMGDPTTSPVTSPTDSSDSDSGESDSGNDDALIFGSDIDNNYMNRDKGDKSYNINVELNNSIGLYTAAIFGLCAFMNMALCWFCKKK